MKWFKKLLRRFFNIPIYQSDIDIFISKKTITSIYYKKSTEKERELFFVFVKTLGNFVDYYDEIDFNAYRI